MRCGEENVGDDVCRSERLCDGERHCLVKVFDVLKNVCVGEGCMGVGEAITRHQFPSLKVTEILIIARDTSLAHPPPS